MTVITSANYPNIIFALQTVDADSGMTVEDSYEIPDLWSTNLEQIETLMSRMGLEELDEFCIGDTVVVDEILAKNPEYKVILTFISGFFDEWTHTPEDY